MSFMNILKSKRAVIKSCGAPATISSQVVDIINTYGTLRDLFFK